MTYFIINFPFPKTETMSNVQLYIFYCFASVIPTTTQCVEPKILVPINLFKMRRCVFSYYKILAFCKFQSYRHYIYYCCCVPHLIKGDNACFVNKFLFLSQITMCIIMIKVLGQFIVSAIKYISDFYQFNKSKQWRDGSRLYIYVCIINTK